MALKNLVEIVNLIHVSSGFIMKFGSIMDSWHVLMYVYYMFKGCLKGLVRP